MATGPDMYKALKRATSNVLAGSEFTICIGDGEDLCKLTVKDLTSLGFDVDSARKIRRDLAKKKLDELGKAMGLTLLAKTGPLTLIPGEGARRAQQALKDDPQTLEEMLKEIYAMRHPERFPA